MELLQKKQWVAPEEQISQLVIVDDGLWQKLQDRLAEYP